MTLNELVAHATNKEVVLEKKENGIDVSKN